MPGYSTLNRFSQAQLQTEQRKQEAHLKKINEMQRRSTIDNRSPQRCPHLHQGFVRQLGAKRQTIDKENEQKSKKLLGIMTSKAVHFPAPSYSPNPTQRSRPSRPAQNENEYFERVSKVKGEYDTQGWQKDYEQHKQHLRLRKNNSMFTPLDVGPHRTATTRTNSVSNTARTTPLLTASEVGSNQPVNEKTDSPESSRQAKHK